MNYQDFDSYESNYGILPFEPIMIEYRRKIVLENLLKYSHDNILEIGCGTDPIFHYYSNYSEMTVIEPVSSFYQLASEMKGNSNICIYNDIFENVSERISDKKFDFIILSCLLHEVPDTFNFLKKLHGICNSNTIIHINVPNANSFHRLLALEMGIIDNIFESSSLNKLMKQENVFNLEKLAELLSECNFSIIDSGSYFIKPFTHAQMSKLVESGFIGENLMEGLNGLSKYMPDIGSEIFINCRIKQDQS